MTMSRRTALGLRLVAASALTIAIVGGVASAVILGTPERPRDAIAVSARPAPSSSVVACAGDLLALGRSANAADISVSARAQDVSASTSGSEVTESVMDAPDVASSEGALALVSQPEGRTRVDVAGATSAQARADDQRGFAASACAAPQAESWLVGGSGQTGASDLIVLSNPGDVAAHVDIAVFTAEGMLEPPSGRDIVVPPMSQRVLPLAALVLGEQSPVVRVTASEAPVRAVLQASILRTLVPGGVDQVDATAAPAHHQSIIAVPRSEVTVEGSEATSILRVLAPSSATTARVRVTDARTGRDIGAETELTLEAGLPTELGLTGLDEGTYAIHIDAGEPVVAAAWQATGFGAGDDFAWFEAAEPVTTPSVFSVARGPSPTVTFSNEGTEPATVTLTDPGTGTVVAEVALDPGASRQQAVRAGASFVLTPGGAGIVRVAVTYAGAGALAGYSVPAGDVASGVLTVYPQ